MEDTPDGMIDELRIAAFRSAAEDGLTAEETLEWEAADMLRSFLDFVTALAEGGNQAAVDFLDPVKRMERARSRRE